MCRCSQPPNITFDGSDPALPWEHRGIFRAEALTRNAREIMIHGQRSSQEDVSLVLFLERVT